MTWDLEEAGDDAVTLRREDGLFLSATRVADDSGASNRAHRWTEWRFAVTDGEDGDQLTEHGWEIVDEEHLWEVLDGFTYRFRPEADVGAPADERLADESADGDDEAAAENDAGAGTDERADATPEGESGDDPASRNEPIAAATREPAAERVSVPDSAGEAEPETDEDGAQPDGDVPSPADTVSDESVPDDTMDVAAEARVAADRNTALAEGVGNQATRSDRATAGTEIAAPTDANGAGEQAPDADGPPARDRTTADPAPADAAGTDAQPETPSDSSPSTDSAAPEAGNAARVDDPDVTYRPATPADAGELATIYRSAVNRERGSHADAKSVTADDVREWIEAHGLLVAVARDDVVGCVCLEETDPARVKLSGLAVHDDWRGKGIESGLLDRAEAAVNAGNGETIWLTAPESHPFLPDLYRQRGYERTGESPLADRDDEIVMEKHVG